MAPQVMALSAAAPGKAKKPTQTISLAAGSIAGGTFREEMLDGFRDGMGRVWRAF